MRLFENNCLEYQYSGPIGDFDEFGQIRLRELLFFERLSALGSITATARELRMPKASASRWLAQLEENVGHELVRRTTRSLALTERGEVFVERVREVLNSARRAQLAVQEGEPGGTIRVSVPVPLGRLLGGDVIASFRRELPRVRLEIALENRRVDLVRDRFDLAIRGGALKDSGLIARRLAEVPLVLYAAYEFAGVEPSDAPLIAAPGDGRILRAAGLELGRAAVVVDDRTAVADALVAGAGVGILPAFLGEAPREQGLLVRVRDEPLARTPVHALFRPEQRDDVRVRVLIAEIESELHRTLGP